MTDIRSIQKRAIENGLTLEPAADGLGYEVRRNRVLLSYGATPLVALNRALDGPPEIQNAIRATRVNRDKRAEYEERGRNPLTRGPGARDQLSDILTGYLQDEDGFDEAAYQKVVDENGLTAQARCWRHLNSGMRRMNLGNRLRGLLNNGKAVKIGPKRIKAKNAENIDG